MGKGRQPNPGLFHAPCFISNDKENGLVSVIVFLLLCGLFRLSMAPATIG